jgi:hypothetical protein
VRLPDFVRRTTFRWTLAVAGAFVLCALLLFDFVYWQTAVYMMSQNDVSLIEELRVFAMVRVPRTDNCVAYNRARAATIHRCCHGYLRFLQIVAFPHVRLPYRD